MKIKTMAGLANMIGQKHLVETYKQSSKSLYERLQIDYEQADISLDFKELSYSWDIPEWIMSHRDVAHGGMVAVVFDTMMGILAMARSIPKGRVAFTKTLSIEYVAPLRIKGSAEVSVVVKEIHGSKLVLRASLKDHSGTVTSTAEGVFVLKDYKKLK